MSLEIGSADAQNSSVHQGDSIPISFLDSVEPPLKTREQLTMIGKTKATAVVGTTLPPWLAKHREGVSKPLIDSFINTVRAIPGRSSRSLAY
jgi:hypothetical protein